MTEFELDMEALEKALIVPDEGNKHQNEEQGAQQFHTPPPKHTLIHDMGTMKENSSLKRHLVAVSIPRMPVEITSVATRPISSADKDGPSMISHDEMCGYHYKFKLHLHEPLAAIKLVFQCHNVWGEEVSMFGINKVEDFAAGEHEEAFELAYDLPITREFRGEFDYIGTDLNPINFFVAMVTVWSCRTLEGVLHTIPIDRWQLVTNWALGKQQT
jgi:hypothetical protein